METMYDNYKEGINKNNSYEIKLKSFLNAINIYQNLSDLDKQRYESVLYLVYRDLGALYFTTNKNQKESISCFQKSLELSQKGKYDTLINLAITKQMLGKNYLLLSLMDEQESYVDVAENLTNEAKEILFNTENNLFTQQINENFKIINAIRNNKIYTNISFTLPYHLKLSNNSIFQINYKGLSCSIKIINQKTNDIYQVADGSIIYALKDKYGLINRTQIEVNIPKFINPDKEIRVNEFLKRVWLPYVEAINVFNEFLNKYKYTSKSYWLDNLNEAMVFSYGVKIFADDIIIKNIPLNIWDAVSVGSYVNFNEIDNDQLQQSLNGSATEYWELLRLNSLNSYHIKNYNDAIIQINLALENYLYYFCRKVLKDKVPEKELNNFLIGTPVYNQYFLKEYITEENFNQAVRRGVIKSNNPTVFAIIKKCKCYIEKLPQKTITTYLVKIKQLRNEIMHGCEIIENLEKVAFDSITAFDNLIELLKNVY